MMTEDQDYDVRFEEEGVRVHVPAEVRIQLFPRVSLRRVRFTRAMGTQDDFHPLRVIGNLKFGVPPRTSAPVPVLVEVDYTSADSSRAEKRGGRLALAYWDDELRRWVRFEEEEKYGYGLVVHDEGGSAYGHAYLQLTEIGDPAISWGT